MNIYLASKSPRRRELLAQMGVAFDLLLVDTPEVIAPGESPEDYSKRVTTEKLLAAQEAMLTTELPVKPILCADTECIIDGVILGKPQSRQEALDTLRNYSGRSHEVITSVGMLYFDFQKILMQKTIVTFGVIPDEAIEHYLNSDNYMDKSGSYSIQSYIGQFISHIEGCFYSVMGLPLYKVRELLTELGI